MTDINWEMKFDLNTLEHLGVKLYTQYPPMIAELISNSWDADAKVVKIELFDEGNKKIIVSDNGHSMTAEELNDCFLTVGRNRRLSTQSGVSQSGRAVLGKKGIGKLSMFGIAEKIKITTIKNSEKNAFEMHYPTMKSSGGRYLPNPLIKRQHTSEADGTVIELDEIKRKSPFDSRALANSLPKRFSIFDELHVQIYRNGTLEATVSNTDLFEGISKQFEWNFPIDFQNGFDSLDYCINRGITGKLLTSHTPLNKLQQGVTLLARKKLVQENAYFDDRSNDYFHSYLYGYLEIDFIDQDNELDNVSTDRKSLIWEGSELEELKQHLNNILKFVSKEWRSRRLVAKKEKFKQTYKVDLDQWLQELSPVEKPLATKIAHSILGNENLDGEKAAALFAHIQDAFSLQGFQEFAQKLDDLGALDDSNAIKLLDDWGFIEAKEMAKLSEGRISTINQFEKYIQQNVSETKVMQKFLENFPWILDPRMNNFEREVTYSNWLKEKFPEDKLEGSNKRIDFLCSNTNGAIHIIELKRPRIKIGLEELNQCTQYLEFIRSKLPHGVSTVKVILISENHKYGPGIEDMVDALRKAGNFEIKSYSDLLTQARTYHSDFIKKYEEIVDIKSKQNKTLEI
ncbi:ATP-binding protein [Undibacterium baiyunense]|uniref:ATP-binding protein n=1 Tax=Undibacterium baiyunense TaxID=2828731 RepID=A0A941DBF8_9BURK|nr:ATP-binding protein [Undibacterium baiyunense]MBR7745604.1 ATP-binding protein [Undibacterium baiyunense]